MTLEDQEPRKIFTVSFKTLRDFSRGMASTGDGRTKKMELVPDLPLLTTVWYKNKKEYYSVAVDRHCSIIDV